jgi:hypothetical protein
MMLHRKGRACVAALRPSYRDVVVVTTLAGKVAALDGVKDYDAAIQRALRLAGEQTGPVKVLPMTMGEALTFCRISVDEFLSDFTDDEWREHCIRVCTPGLTDPDPRVRADAVAVLTDLGAMPQC